MKVRVLGDTRDTRDAPEPPPGAERGAGEERRREGAKNEAMKRVEEALKKMEAKVWL